MRKNTRPPKAKRFSTEQTDQLLNYLKNNNAPEENFSVAKGLIEGNLWLCDELERGTLTIAKLRKFLQIQGTEKSHRHTGQSTAKNSKKDKEKSKGHGRNAAEAYAGARIAEVPHPTLSPGDICPAVACGGRLYEMTEPGFVVRVTGSPLAMATRYELQKLRCSICETIYTAPLPEGVADQKYDAGFISMLMINKYFMSVPLYRQDRLQNYLGMPLPDSTQWDLMFEHKDMLKILYDAFSVDAANGLALCYDDTSVKVQSEMKAKRLAEKGQKNKHNTFTTGLVSLHEDHHTYLYMTDNRVAGQFIGDLLALRDPDLDLPIIMCDALVANIPQDIADNLYILCYCLVHARRQFYELPDGYDDLADEVIAAIGKIYFYEDYAKSLEPQARLAYHQKHSQPIMTKLKTYLESQEKEFEPNGVAGNAIAYVLNRWGNLSGFLEHAHAPLDNNLVERALKLVIQTRKSSMFYKSLNSAAFASYVQSALYSAAQNNINPYDYMKALIENKIQVIKAPKDWFPWTYQKTLKAQKKANDAKKIPEKQAIPGSG
jgi:transposase